MSGGACVDEDVSSFLKRRRRSSEALGSAPPSATSSSTSSPSTLGSLSSGSSEPEAEAAVVESAGWVKPVAPPADSAGGRGQRHSQKQVPQG